MDDYMGIDDRGTLVLRRGLGTVMALVAVTVLAVMFEFGHATALPSTVAGPNERGPSAPAPAAVLASAQVVAQKARFCPDSSFCTQATGCILSPGRQPSDGTPAT